MFRTEGRPTAWHLLEEHLHHPRTSHQNLRPSRLLPAVPEYEWWEELVQCTQICWHSLGLGDGMDL